MPQIIGKNPATVGETEVYTVVNYSPGIFTWTVDKGSIVSGQGTDSIRVQWNSPGSSEIKVVIKHSNNTTQEAVIVIDVLQT